MKSDEGFSNNVDKQMLIQLWNENVTQLKKRFRKAAFCGLFFTLF